MRLALNLKTILLGVVILAASFFLSLKAMDWIWPRGISQPVLAKLPPLPPVNRPEDAGGPSAAARRDDRCRA